MIFALSLLGLAIVTAILLLPKKFMIVVIPVVYCAYYYVATTIPSYFGYAIDEQFIGDKQAVLLSNVELDKKLYVLVRIDGDDRPRLVEIANTKENKETLEKTANKGIAVLQFGKGGTKTGGGEGNGGSAGTVDLVPLDQSKMLSKDAQ
jgi:hypothetical protein